MLFPVLVGYDLSAEGGVKATLDEFDQEVGLQFLRAIHLNDSKGSLSTEIIQTGWFYCAFWFVLYKMLKLKAYCLCFCVVEGKLGCNLDRHEDIGKGHIGISAFQDVVNEPRLDNIPLILETPGR